MSSRVGTWTVTNSRGDSVTLMGDWDPAEVTYIIEKIEKGNTMSDQHTRMRVVLDLPVDPSTASERVMKAIANEARDYVQIVLVKDREVTLTDHVEVVDVHVHRSTPDQACGHCVEDLAMDQRQ